jgi:hypothetical protein
MLFHLNVDGEVCDDRESNVALYFEYILVRDLLCVVSHAYMSIGVAVHHLGQSL